MSVFDGDDDNNDDDNNSDRHGKHSRKHHRKQEQFECRIDMDDDMRRQQLLQQCCEEDVGGRIDMESQTVSSCPLVSVLWLLLIVSPIVSQRSQVRS
jgi:hypothetical protein